MDASVGVCMLYPRALAQEIGGYDPGFSPVWFDDLDLSLSARRFGRKVFVLPDVHVVHRASLRNPRGDGGSRAATARRTLGRAVPQAAKDAVIAAARLDRPTPAQRERLRHHYAYWREKWGWDLLNPDVEAIRRRWGETEICWRDR